LLPIDKILNTVLMSYQTQIPLNSALIMSNWSVEFVWLFGNYRCSGLLPEDWHAWGM